MNKLKRLFGPQALASTVAPALSVTALASGGSFTSYYVLADSGAPGGCGTGTVIQEQQIPANYFKYCTYYNPSSGRYFYCCDSNDWCNTTSQTNSLGFVDLAGSYACGQPAPNWLPCIHINNGPDGIVGYCWRPTGGGGV